MRQALWTQIEFLPVAGAIFLSSKVLCRVFSKRSSLSGGVCCRGKCGPSLFKKIASNLSRRRTVEVEFADVSVRVDDILLRTVVEVVIRPLFFWFSEGLFFCSHPPKHSTASKKTTTMLLRCLSASVEPRSARTCDVIMYLTSDEMCHLICCQLFSSQGLRLASPLSNASDTRTRFCKSILHFFVRLIQ